MHTRCVLPDSVSEWKRLRIELGGYTRGYGASLDEPMGRKIDASTRPAPRRCTITVRFLLLAFLLTLTGCTAIPATACPAALLEGELTEQDGELVVVHPDFVERVDWGAAGYHVRRADGYLVVADWVGVKARAGDTVHIGGGERDPGLWTPCGQFDVTDA